MVINRLQVAKGGKEYISKLEAARVKNFTEVDFASHAASMGALSETVNSISDLEAAFKRAKNSDRTYVISIKTDGYEWLKGSAFCESPTLENFNSDKQKKAYKEHISGKNKQRKGV